MDNITTGVEKSITPIQQISLDVGNLIDDLYSRVTKLEDRLLPVLSPPTPITDDNASNPPYGNSAICNILEGYAKRLTEISRYLDSITIRVEA